MNNSNRFISRKLTKFFRLFKYVILSIVFVLLALLRWVSGSHSDESDNKRLSKEDFKNLLSHFPKANADVPGGGGGGGDDGGGGGGGSGGDGGGGWWGLF